MTCQKSECSVFGPVRCLDVSDKSSHNTARRLPVVLKSSHVVMSAPLN